MKNCIKTSQVDFDVPSVVDEILKEHEAEIIYESEDPAMGDDWLRSWYLTWPKGCMHLRVADPEAETEARAVGAIFIYLWSRNIDAGFARDLATLWGYSHYGRNYE